jgi:hypothetical protein
LKLEIIDNNLTYIFICSLFNDACISSDYIASIVSDEIEIVFVYVRLYLENGYTDLHQTWYAYSMRPERDFRKVQKNVLSSSPSDGGSCSSETNHDRRTVPRPKLFVSKRRLQGKCPEFNNNKIIIIFMIFNDTYRIIRLMLSFRAININTKSKNLSNFPAVILRALC